MKLNFNILGSRLFRYLSEIFPSTYSRLRLPRLISDGMVLQRNAKVKIWGWAAPGDKVTVRFNGESYNTTTLNDGKWEVTLSPLEAGGPYNMEIIANQKITINDILVGDVWVCSGQSNMVLPMDRVSDLYMDEIAHSTNPEIRQFIVPDRWDFKEPQQELESGRWEQANPQSILQFSAAGYFFAKSLFEKYHVPIGLIKVCIGGSSAEAWLSEDALKAFPVHLAIAQKYKNAEYLHQIVKYEKVVNNRWYHRLNKLDQGLNSGKKNWFLPDCDASTWATMDLPGNFEDHGLKDFSGVVWFRKEIIIPASMAGQPARLLLGRIVDSDEAYVNGKLVGTTSYQYPPRRYRIPKNLLKTGKNIIAIRVISNTGCGGFIRDKAYQLIAGGQRIDLQGEWQYKVGAVTEPLPSSTYFPQLPLGLFNGMIAPLLNYAMKGVIWYQGESNDAKPHEYQKLFAALITDWRQKWHQGDFPFLYVQLANYMPAKDRPSESNWAELREAQLKTLAVPNTGMAVAIDLGDWNDLHPLNKKDIGKRLALAAQKVAYGDINVIYSGPIYQSMKIEGNKIILTFTNTGNGLVVKGDGEPGHFAIAGADNKFVWAKAKIEQDQVVVWNDQITNPVAVRYAWADNPVGANLYNQEGLPASPFRTGQ